MAEMIVVEKEKFESLMMRLDHVEALVKKQASDNAIRARVQAVAKNGCISAPAVARIMGWSATTMWRKLNDRDILMTKDGNRWKMSIDEFLDWYSNYLMTNIKP